MKIRSDFVTNSSSSSFIINKSEENKEKLINHILPEIYRQLSKEWYSDEEINEELSSMNWINEDYGLAYHESSYNRENDPYYDDPRSDNSDDREVFVITNNDGIRFNWAIIGDILSKHNIKWERGYCD